MNIWQSIKKLFGFKTKMPIFPKVMQGRRVQFFVSTPHLDPEARRAQKKFESYVYLKAKHDFGADPKFLKVGGLLGVTENEKK